MRTRTTRRDIAQALGVSVMTVTRAFAAPRLVAAPLRRKILALAKRLNYRPHPMASALKRGRSCLLGVVVPTLIHPIYSLIVDRVQYVAGARGYGVTVAKPSHEHLFRISDMDFLLSQPLDAITLNCPIEAAAYETLKRSSIPYALLCRPARRDMKIPLIETDDLGGAVAAVEHLIGLGHRRISHLAGDPHSWQSLQRLRGWRDTLRQHGLPCAAVRHTDWNFESGYTTALALIQEQALGTAVFAASDYLAFGVLKACAEHGLTVPGAVSVVGFADDPVCQWHHPMLTTVHQPFAELAEQAVLALFDALVGKPRSGRMLLPTQLIVRETTAAPRAANKKSRWPHGLAPAGHLDP